VFGLKLISLDKGGKLSRWVVCLQLLLSNLWFRFLFSLDLLFACFRLDHHYRLYRLPPFFVDRHPMVHLTHPAVTVEELLLFGREVVCLLHIGLRSVLIISLLGISIPHVF